MEKAIGFITSSLDPENGAVTVCMTPAVKGSASFVKLAGAFCWRGSALLVYLKGRMIIFLLYGDAFHVLMGVVFSGMTLSAKHQNTRFLFTGNISVLKYILSLGSSIIHVEKAVSFKLSSNCFFFYFSGILSSPLSCLTDVFKGTPIPVEAHHDNLLKYNNVYTRFETFISDLIWLGSTDS